MISLTGNCLLVFSIATSILAIFTKRSIKAYIFWISSLAVITAFLLLILAFITSDFSVKNVFLNSSTIKPLIYKIAGSWASHEGSMLLYVSMLSFISSLYTKVVNYQGNTRNVQITILAFIQILFLFFIYYTSNPFDNFKFAPEQGLGLNPVLQDKALSIHPPLLYMGYVSYVTLYVNAILLLLIPKERTTLIKDSLRLSGFALIMLTAGIGLGAWWAYRELGWGGYWFFDPVENISLMPWIAGISLHHFLLVTNKSRKFFYWSVITSFVAFLLTLYGLFFVRSGIITSVHSFAFSRERGFYLFVICSILTFLAFAAFIGRKKENYTSSKDNVASVLTIRDKAIMGGNILWITALLSLFIAVIYPIYQSFFYENNVAIDPKYFHQIFIPIFIPLMLIAAIIPYLNNHQSFSRKLIHLLIPFLITLVIFHYIPKPGIISTAIIFASTLLMIQMTNLFLIESNYFQKSLTPRKLSLIIGHFSLGLLAFSININVLFSKEIEFIGKTGESVSDEFFLVKLDNIRFSNTEVYYRQIAEFSVQDNNGNVVILKPENRLYKIENSLSQETDIYSYLTHDMLASLSKVNGNTIHAIIYYKPMIWFIWLSIFLIAGSFVIYITKVK
ncbi:MAG: heme lyase CcmF/NrfE family subunit [Candidatus Megaira endosymbiont of Mesostigma viride]|nr:MAG: heme lyase CcmF/NrfE family subunit [Candidatus Megaira endosymbiont of Mesostigma viride]HJK88583.1 heme lyase CcmF/NrfE family subunit [Candidatus Megaira endosymbiont of Mesostigma viride]